MRRTIRSPIYCVSVKRRRSDLLINCSCDATLSKESDPSNSRCAMRPLMQWANQYISFLGKGVIDSRLWTLNCILFITFMWAYILMCFNLDPPLAMNFLKLEIFNPISFTKHLSYSIKFYYYITIFLILKKMVIINTNRFVMAYLKKTFSVHLKWKERGGKANKLNETLGCQVMFVRCYGQIFLFYHPKDIWRLYTNSHFMYRRANFQEK